jgi:opacity protein-like surface antigen
MLLPLKPICLFRRTSFFLFLLCVALIGALNAVAQTRIDNRYYARVNTFGVLAAYSNDSSHMLLGDAERRKLLDIGGMYSRRLFLNRIVNWEYSAEVLPVALESDPLTSVLELQTSPSPGTTTLNAGSSLITCAPLSLNYSFTYMGVNYAGTNVFYCHGRQWTIGEAMSPVGFSWNFRPRHKLQPFLIGHGGYMYSTRPIPVSTAGSFNFTFDIGAGLELFRTHSQSIRAEYRYHHISNHYTAIENPGVDSGLVQLTYSFGR